MKVNVASRLFVEAMWAHIEKVNPNPTEESLAKLFLNDDHQEVRRAGETIAVMSDENHQVTMLVDDLKNASMFAFFRWYIAIINHKQLQDHGKLDDLGKELQVLIDGFEQYCREHLGEVPSETINSIATQEDLESTMELLRDIESIVFLRYLTDRKVLITYPEVNSIIQSLEKFSLAGTLSTLADNVRVSPSNVEYASDTIVSFKNSTSKYLRLAGAKGLLEIIMRVARETEGMVRLLQIFTGWEEEYCRERLSNLLKYFAKTTKKNWRGLLPWMIKMLYQKVLTQGVTKTQAACFIHAIFEPIIPDFTSWEIYAKRHPEVAHYDYRQIQLREVRKFARIK